MTPVPLPWHDGHVDTPTELHNGALPARITAVLRLLEAGDIAAAEQGALTLCEDFPRAADGFAILARCAGARGDGTMALERWLACKARFPDQAAKWQIGLAYAYLNAHRPAEAGPAFAAVLATNPTHQAALAGHATAISRTAPGEAEPLWLKLFGVAGGVPKAAWQVTRSRALADAGQTDRAISVLQQTLDETPGHSPAVTLLEKLRPGVGAPTAAASLPSDTLPNGDSVRPLERARQQRMRMDLRGARVSLMEALHGARHLNALTSVFRVLPSLFQGFERAEVLRTLRARVAEVLPADDAETVCLQMRLDLALGDYDALLQRWDDAPPLPSFWTWRFERLVATLRAPVFPDFGAPKVFGIGLNKTGTSSLGAALDRLGYLQAHFDSPFTHEILSDRDFVLFDAATDSPVSARFETLFARFPNARFILTERPLEPWLASFNNHFERWHGSASWPFRAPTYENLKDSVWGLDLRLAHGSLYAAYPDPITAYHAHIRRVENFFSNKPPGKLLRHNVFKGDGWPELCAFLGHEVPSEPYPWSNQTPAAEAPAS